MVKFNNKVSRTSSNDSSVDNSDIDIEGSDSSGDDEIQAVPC